MATKYKDITNHNEVYIKLFTQCNNVEWIENALEQAWYSFFKDDWSYDGATFVREHKNEYWEVAAFIHDWLNSVGYVGKDIDLYFLEIMRQLKYSTRLIFERSKWMQFTFFNVFWHKIKGTYKSNKLPQFVPTPIAL